MIKVKSILLFSALLSITIVLPKAIGDLTRPDLVVRHVSSPNLDSGVVKVRVKNVGDAPAGKCHLKLSITPDGEDLKIFSPPVPALSADQETEVEVQTGLLLSQAIYEAIVDRSNVVRESNERNNALKGKFGGKP